MKQYSRRFLVLALSALLAGCSSSAYLDANSISPAKLNPPPKASSQEYQDEVEAIINMQKKATSKRIATAASERDMSVELMTLSVDKKLTRASYPALYELLDKSYNSSQIITDNAKAYWKTKRPYLQEKRVKALITSHDNPAYPSAHTTDSYTIANVLGMVMPEKKQIFLKRAGQIAANRVLVGMHFPHDIDGGEQLAKLIVAELKKSPDFQSDLADAKKEMKAKKS